MNEQKRGARLGTKLVLAGVVALLTAEVGLRLIDRKAGRSINFWLPPENKQPLHRTHPYMGFEHIPGSTKENVRDDGYLESMSINGLGFRGPDVEVAKQPGVYRILCLGGSTTFGTGATRNAFSYPARLEAHLNDTAPDGKRFEVWNCAVNGYNSAENLINLELNLVEYEPDAILIYQAANDARPVQARGFEPDYAHLRQSWVQTRITPFERFMLKASRLFCWTTHGLDPEQQLTVLSRPIFVPNFQQLHQRSDDAVNADGVRVYLRNIGHMIAIAREHGIEPVLSTFAKCTAKERDQGPDGERFFETVDAMNAGLRELATGKNVPLFEIARILDERCELFNDWMHLGDEGSDQHGRAAFEEAQRLGAFGL